MCLNRLCGKYGLVDIPRGYPGGYRMQSLVYQGVPYFKWVMIHLDTLLIQVRRVSTWMGRMYYHRNKIKDTLQGSVRRFEYHGHPKYQILTKFLACDVIGFRTSIRLTKYRVSTDTKMFPISLSSLPTPYYQEGVWERMKMKSTTVAVHWNSPLIY